MLHFGSVKELFGKGKNKSPLPCSSSSSRGKSSEMGLTGTEEKWLWQTASLKGLVEWVDSEEPQK